jgi:hypothetical protein
MEAAPESDFQLSLNSSIQYRGTEDAEGAQRKAMSNLKFDIVNIFLCAPSVFSVSAVVNAYSPTFN